MEKANIENAEAENAEATRTENSEKMKKKVIGENIVHVIPTSSAAAEPEVGPEIEVLETAMKQHCLIQEALFSDFEERFELETGSVTTEKVSPVVTGLLYSTFSARGQ